jgi:osmotically-inducible protein OsmY
MKNRNMNALIVMLMIMPVVMIINGQVLAASLTAARNTDDSVAMTVAGKIAHDSLLKNMPIGVADYIGAITLSGAVYTPQQKAHATEVARSVEGVKKVNNLLEVVRQ